MSDPLPPHSAAGRNLLFGIVALQMGFLDGSALVAALRAWALDKARPLGQILLEQGKLTAGQLQLLDGLVQEHLQRHGDDAARSLAALSPPGAVRDQLGQLADPDLHASLTCVPADESAAANRGATRWPGGAAGLTDTGPPEADCDATRTDGIGPGAPAGPRYRVLRPHARGGLGEVFLAKDQELHREVALKEIRERHADDAQSRGRFLLEAEITGGLEHPGVVPVYGLGKRPDGRPYYAMRFIRGESLDEAIRRFHEADAPGRDPGERSLALRKLLSQFVAVCNTLAYAHSRGVIHRDLKPANIMLGKFGETLVVDWGLAKVVGRHDPVGTAEDVALRPPSAADTPATRTGAVLGTPAYMSPEQAAGQGDRIGPASDIYGLGATLYALLTGRAPFEGGELTRVLHEVQRGAFRPPRERNRAVPRALEAVCLKAMALRPEDRYPAAQTLAADIEHWLADEPVTAYREPWAARAWRWTRRHRTAVVGLTAALVAGLALGGGGWLWLERDRQARRDETLRGINLALGKAEQLRDQARRAPLDDPAQAEAALVLWKQALAAADHAEGVRSAGLADEATRQRLAGLRAELRAAVVLADKALGQRRKEVKLLADLERAALVGATTKRGAFVGEAGAAAYAKAFADFGIDVRASSPQAMAAWLQQCRPAVVEPVLLALNDWALYPESGKDQQRLRQILGRVDPNRWRGRLLAAARRGDTARLRALATEAAPGALSPQALRLLGLTLISRGETALAVDLLRKARDAYPAEFWVNLTLAFALLRHQDFRPEALEEALGCLRVAAVVRPRSSTVYYQLGNVLLMKGVHALHGKKHLDEAIAAFESGLVFDPDSASIHHNLAEALLRKNELDKAIAHFQKVIPLEPKNYMPHFNIGVALQRKGQPDKAIAAFRAAIRLKGNDSNLHSNLGHALRDNGQPDEALPEFRTAIRLNEHNAVAHLGLGLALKDDGQFSEALAAFRRCRELASQNPGLQKMAAAWARQAEQMVELDARLPAVLRGEVPLTDTERLRFAECLHLKRLYDTSARFYAKALAAQPELAQDPRSGQRYNAACAAAMAGCGKGEDAARLDDAARVRWRGQALDWLHADLKEWAGRLTNATSQDRVRLRQTLQHWRRDRDLAGLRDEKALAGLPAAERDCCRRLWAEVATLLERAQGND